jgi:hypothetical protein
MYPSLGYDSVQGVAVPRDATVGVMPSRLGQSRRRFTSDFEVGCKPVPLAGGPVQLRVVVGTSGSVILTGQVRAR